MSVVVTVRNEADAIGQLLSSLRNQTYQPDEVVIADAGSTDGTAEALRAEALRWDGLVVIDVPGANISAGRNAAIRTARGSVIATTDAGTRLPAQWLESLTAPLLADGGQAKVVSGYSAPGGSSLFERTLSTVILPRRAEFDAGVVAPSARTLAFRREDWLLVGGFPEFLLHCEDVVFINRLRARGVAVVLEPEACVTWDARRHLRSFARQYFLYARGDGNGRLYARRHAVRYGAYASGCVLLWGARRSAICRVLVAAGMSVHFGRFYRRVLEAWPGRSTRDVPAILALVPVIVVAGDIAKMIGYPVGLIERAVLGGERGLSARRSRIA